MNKVFINNLPYKMSWQDLKDFLNENAGKCTFVKIFTDPLGRSKGCAVAEFADAESCAKAIALNDTEINGRKIGVREDKEKDKQPAVSPKQVYIGNIPENLSIQDLASNIEPLEAVDISIKKNFALIAFKTPEDAEACVQKLNGKMLNDKALDVHLDKKFSKFN